MSGLRVGEGGRAIVAQEVVTWQSVKNRLKVASEAAGVEIKFRRSGLTGVVFEVVRRNGP